MQTIEIFPTNRIIIIRDSNSLTISRFDTITETKSDNSEKIEKILLERLQHPQPSQRFKEIYISEDDVLITNDEPLNFSFTI